MKRLLAHMELVLTAIGLIVIWLVPALFLEPTSDRWKATALTAIVVGIIHAFIFWVVRRRQRQVRNKVIADIRGMLKDRVNNQLMVILMSVPTSTYEIEQLKDIHRSVTKISNHIETLSEESLQTWHAEYTYMMPNDRRGPAS